MLEMPDEAYPTALWGFAWDACLDIAGKTVVGEG